MVKRYYCTYFDKSYLVRGLSLISSMNRHEKNYTLFVVCLDELTRVILGKLELTNVVLLSLHEIEERDVPLSVARRNRSLVEYYWTLTPSIILYLLRTYRLDQLTYLDSDMLFFSSPDPIFHEFGDNSILIHAHRFSEKKKPLEVYGIYNVGLMSFKNDENGIECLKWWRDRCNEWCYARVEDGKYGDQLYLNHFLTLFKKVHVLEHPGAGIAPWNHEQYNVTRDAVSGDIFVDGYPCVFYHFHALKFYQPNIIFPLPYNNYDFPKDILEICYLPYLYALHNSIFRVWEIVDDYAFGLYNTLVYDAPLVATNNLHSTIIQFSESDWYPLDNSWNCYNAHYLATNAPSGRILIE